MRFTLLLLGSVAPFVLWLRRASASCGSCVRRGTRLNGRLPAARLNFIRDSDKILVLNTGGTINAYDTPENLLKDTDGYFARQMAEENSGM